MDFDPSGKSGFYVTTDPIQAADWARKQGHPTITQFNIPNSELAKMDIKAFDTANGEWANFVTEGRQGTLSHIYDTRGNLILATDPEAQTTSYDWDSDFVFPTVQVRENSDFRTE